MTSRGRGLLLPAELMEGRDGPASSEAWSMCNELTYSSWLPPSDIGRLGTSRARELREGSPSSSSDEEALFTCPGPALRLRPRIMSGGEADGVCAGVGRADGERDEMTIGEAGGTLPLAEREGPAEDIVLRLAPDTDEGARARAVDVRGGDEIDSAVCAAPSSSSCSISSSSAEELWAEMRRPERTLRAMVACDRFSPTQILCEH